jgi:hypothetical protein
LKAARENFVAGVAVEGQTLFRTALMAEHFFESLDDLRPATDISVELKLED